MSNNVDKLYDLMRDALRESAGKGDWLDVGKAFRFVCEHGSHYHVLDGMITGIQLSDEGGLEVEVSNRTMWGRPIKYLAFSTERGWSIRLDLPDREVEETYFDGHLNVW